MAKDTKERILTAALEMFSHKENEGTNIRDLAASFGLVKSGVCKHFESKEEISHEQDHSIDRKPAEKWKCGCCWGGEGRLTNVPDKTMILMRHFHWC